MLHSINWPNFIGWLSLLREILDNIYILYFLLIRLRRHEFWNQHYLSSQAAFSTWPKSQDKNVNILRTKRAFKIKQQAFFITFKKLSLKQIKQIFLEGESPTLNKPYLTIVTIQTEFQTLRKCSFFCYIYVYSNQTVR